MESPGTMLRNAREELGLTIADVAAMTRIPKTMLGHLEADRFEEYVAEVFVRGHLRNYARELRIDSEAVLQAYERHTGRHRRDPLADAKENSGVEPRRSRRRPIPSAAMSTGNSRGVVESGESAKSLGLQSHFGNIRPSHMVAIVLVLFGIFVMFSFLSSNRATAQDPASFPEAEESAWELEQDIEETRWLLEQSDERE